MHFVGGRRNEVCVRKRAPRRADPVLRTPELAGRSLSPSNALKESCMHLPYQPQAKWEIFEPREPIVHGANVVDDLLDVLGDRVFLRVHLKGKDIFQSALRALNLGTKNGLVEDVMYAVSGPRTTLFSDINSAFPSVPLLITCYLPNGRSGSPGFRIEPGSTPLPPTPGSLLGYSTVALHHTDS